MKKVLFVISGNLSTTPRALKNILLLKDRVKIDILCINRLDKWLKKDEELIEKYNLHCRHIDLKRNISFLWLKASLLQKISKFLYVIFKNNLRISAYASEKSAVLLNIFLKSKIKEKYSAVVAYSYGSLFPAFVYSKKNNLPLIVDIEDYYPGEKIAENKHEKSRRIFLLKKIIPQVSFYTYASLLIGLYLKKLLCAEKMPKNELINNSFDSYEFVFKSNNSQEIRFVWFSQTIDSGRGLELALPALFKFKEKIKLTLIGNLSQNFYDDFLSDYKEIIEFIPLLSQRELNKKLSEFDIGLALELSNVDLNKKLALSNKIFAYSQAGLYILATDTQAQKDFIEKNDFGILTKQNFASFIDSIEKIIENIDEIRNQKQERFFQAKNLSWDFEKEKLLELWNNQCNNQAINKLKN